jgi:hypothetical protein
VNKFQIEAVLREFPFLTAGDQLPVDQERIEEITVSRVTNDLLEIVPFLERIETALVDIRESKRIFLLDSAGKVLTEVRNARHEKSTLGRHVEESKPGETVGEALLRVNADEVVFVIVVHTGHRIESNRSQGGYTVTVYKPPRGFTLKEWLDERYRRAEALVKAMVAEIDAEGQK